MNHRAHSAGLQYVGKAQSSYAKRAVPLGFSDLRRRFIAGCVRGLAGCCVLKAESLLGPVLAREVALRSEKPDSRVELESSDGRLMEGFRWAKNQALAYVSTGDPVGPWYEAALPGRHAFCMRDVSHQSNGAQILGLAAFNENMLRKFAENISASRDWCSYWEINKDNAPAPVDYKNDREFWYNLPANFDVLAACHRQFLWSGSNAYLDPVFLNFYNRTVTDYVRKWDINGDGLMEHLSKYGHRGIASYNEQHIAEMMVGGDLVAAQYAAYRDYAKFQTLLGNKSRAEEFAAKAQHLKFVYNKDWWNPVQDGYYCALGNDGKFHADLTCGSTLDDVLFPLYCEIIEPGHQTEAALGALTRALPANDPKLGGVEGKSYVPEILYRYGRAETAYAVLLGLVDPSLKRREYPEVSFAVVGACATGLMGLRADSTSRVVETFPQVSGMEFVSLKHVPVFDNQISVHHTANGTTTLTNESGGTIQWRSSFPGRFEKLSIDGKEITASTGTRLGGVAETWIVVTVGHDQKRTVQTPRDTSLKVERGDCEGQRGLVGLSRRSA
jgi:hypothetical protein